MSDTLIPFQCRMVADATGSCPAPGRWKNVNAWTYKDAAERYVDSSDDAMDLYVLDGGHVFVQVRLRSLKDIITYKVTGRRVPEFIAEEVSDGRK